MTLRDLQYLVAVYEHNHFGKAADACFVSQPTLSMQIKKLEETLDVVLIERTNKHVLFTEIGKAIAEQAQAVLQQAQSIRDIARVAKNPWAGTLHLGIIPTLAPYLLPHMVGPLSTRFPELTLCLEEEKTAELATKLSQGKLDAIILALPSDADNVITVPLFEEPFLLATPLNHRLAKRKKVTMNDLNDEEMLLLADGHCFRDQALAVCHRVRAVESTQYHATSLETLRYMIASHAGITLMPSLSRRENDGVAYRPFQGAQPARTIGIAWRTTSSKKIMLEKLVAEIKRVISHSACVNNVLML